jgi:hypothetical protein
MRRPAATAGLLALAVLALAACGTTRPAARSGVGLPGDRVLVVARAVGFDDLAVAGRAADLVADALRETAVIVREREFLQEALIAGGALWAPRVLDGTRRGGWPTPEEGLGLLRTHGIATVLAVEVTTYDQVWGRYAKFTRVGLAAAAFHVPTGQVVWRVQSDAEVEEKRGRAFQYAMERAVAELAAAIDPATTGFSVSNTWRSWRR